MWIECKTDSGRPITFNMNRVIGFYACPDVPNATHLIIQVEENEKDDPHIAVEYDEFLAAVERSSMLARVGM